MLMVVCCTYTVMLATYSTITYEYCIYVCSGIYPCNLYRYHIDEEVFCRCLSLARVTNVGPGPLGSGPEVLPGAAEISWRG